MFWGVDRIIVFAVFPVSTIHLQPSISIGIIWAEICCCRQQFRCFICCLAEKWVENKYSSADLWRLNSPRDCSYVQNMHCIIGVFSLSLSLWFLPSLSELISFMRCGKNSLVTRGEISFSLLKDNFAAWRRLLLRTSFHFFLLVYFYYLISCSFLLLLKTNRIEFLDAVGLWDFLNL